MKKPRFTVDQITSASKASKQVEKLRKKAKESSQFISENNIIDTVVLDYKTEVVFIEDAQRDYKKLDGSVKKLVDVICAKLPIRD
ncbi:MAG TPA: hypothetical protein GX497_08695 [Bacillus bacterium]|nr:hypothetical protein [Bacillus sp. (in: firmicutes)]